MNNKTMWICHTATGTALFVVLAMCLRVRVFENFYLCLGYISLVIYAGFLGSSSGALIGGIGVILYCLLTGGLRGMPGWAAGNVLIGALLGQGMRMISGRRTEWKQIITLLGLMTLFCGLGILGVKSLVECLLYAQPMAVRMIKNSYAFAADTFVMWIALPIYLLLRRKTSYGSQFAQQ